MIVRHLMTVKPLTIGLQDSLAVAAERMWSGDCGCLPVLNGEGVVVAMITDRDICMAAWSRSQPPQELRVQEAMSKSLVTCRSEDALEDVESAMRLARVRRLPVVEDGMLEGIISLADIAINQARVKRAGAQESNGLSTTLAVICERPVLRSASENEASPEAQPSPAAAE
jgi:CBS domain-containing protein